MIGFLIQAIRSSEGQENLHATYTWVDWLLASYLQTHKAKLISHFVVLTKPQIESVVCGIKPL